jgi:uncharacterized protein involved in oxidation of intracellular sulfur
MKVLFILNDASYGTEKSYNGLRLATALLKSAETATVSVFLLGDAVICAKLGQKTPDGYYNMERMLKPLCRKGRVLLCGTCMDARGLIDEDIVDGARRSSMAELSQLTLEADRVLVF